jgi:hypothetical protein
LKSDARCLPDSGSAFQQEIKSLNRASIIINTRIGFASRNPFVLAKRGQRYRLQEASRPTYISLPKNSDQAYRIRVYISLQRINLRLGVVHGTLRYKTCLISLLGGIVQESRVVQSQPQPVRMYGAKICYGKDGGMHVRSHGEIAGLFSCCALRDRCHVRQSVALTVLEISWP